MKNLELNTESQYQVESEASLDALLSLQQFEGEADGAMLDLFSTSSCVAGSCLGS